LQDRLGEIEGRGGTLVTISADAAPAFDELRTRLGLTFRFVSDPTLALAAKFGVRQKDEDYALPAVFVVDRAGIVRYAQVGASPIDRAALADVLKALAD
jgi:peroxiredoxin